MKEFHICRRAGVRLISIRMHFEAVEYYSLWSCSVLLTKVIKNLFLSLSGHNDSASGDNTSKSFLFTILPWINGWVVRPVQAHCGFVKVNTLMHSVAPHQVLLRPRQSAAEKVLNLCALTLTSPGKTGYPAGSKHHAARWSNVRQEKTKQQEKESI